MAKKPETTVLTIRQTSCMQLRGDAVPSWMRTASIQSTRNGEAMSTIFYPIGFTAGFLICAYLGWSDFEPPYKQLLMMFSGFCVGGLAVLVIEEIE